MNRTLKIALAVLLLCLSGAALALTKTSFQPAFVSAALPAAGAWGNGATVKTGSAETAKLYCKYTSHATSTIGFADIAVQFSPDASVTWYDYAKCADDAAKAAVTGVDEYQAECMTAVWYVSTPGVGATAESLPVLNFDLRGVAGSFRDNGRIRMRAREAGEAGKMGTLVCTWGLGWIER